MVYCTKCGTKNEEDAVVCVKCGSPLYAGPRPFRRFERAAEEECFGIPHGGAVVGIVIGLIIILAGLSWFLAPYVRIEIWPIVVVIFGILIVIGALYGLRRRY